MSDQPALIPLAVGALSNYMGIVAYRCPQCMYCSMQEVVRLDASSYWHWAHGGQLIQEAFPDMGADDRELLLSGTHPKCWDDMMGSEE